MEADAERKGQKRKLEDKDDEQESLASSSMVPMAADDLLEAQVKLQVQILENFCSWKESDRSAARRATHVLAELAKNGAVQIFFVYSVVVLFLHMFRRCSL